MTKNAIVKFHADDYGICEEVSKNILDCIHNGTINSISIICNTPHFFSCAKTLKSLEIPITHCLHINLLEGKPVANANQVPILVGNNGEFKHSFISIWKKYLFSSSVIRKKIKTQIGIEIKAQIERYLEQFPGDFRIDGHMHLHLLPFIFEVLVNICKQHNFPIQYIRIPRELASFTFYSIKYYFSINFIKFMLLNFLTFKKKEWLTAHNIQSTDYFVGLFATGNMQYKDLKVGLENIKKHMCSKNTSKNIKNIELLMHPGGVSSPLKTYWTTNKRFISYYSSKYRKKEKETLMATNTKKLFDEYKQFFNKLSIKKR